MQKKKQIAAIIPARYGSVRFPGKPLVEILGKTLIQRTYENTALCKELDEILVATDDQRIYDHVKSFGGNVVMTPSSCHNGTDRLAWVLQECPRLQNTEMIVNVQGDEPCLSPDAITQLIEILRSDPSAVMSTVVVKMTDEKEASNPSEVKCVLSLDGSALYFSRSLIPGGQTNAYRKEMVYYKHLGVYAYRPEFLPEYAKLPMTPLQLAEDLEQLKVLEHGYKIKAAIVISPSIGVNTPEDIRKVEQELCKQNLFS